MEIWDILDANRQLTGETKVRGEPLSSGEFHLVVHVWIRNKNGKFLISKRASTKPSPNLWEATGGSAVSGDDSLKTALKEVYEELGITLDSARGQLWSQFIRQYQDGGDHLDVWKFEHDIDLEDLTLQKEEVADALWAAPQQILKMFEKGEMVPSLTYMKDFFDR